MHKLITGSKTFNYYNRTVTFTKTIFRKKHTPKDKNDHTNNACERAPQFEVRIRGVRWRFEIQIMQMTVVAPLFVGKRKTNAAAKICAKLERNMEYSEEWRKTKENPAAALPGVSDEFRSVFGFKILAVWIKFNPSCSKVYAFLCNLHENWCEIWSNKIYVKQNRV